jgi:tetratricopeptide (TPR) repeat protein
MKFTFFSIVTAIALASCTNILNLTTQEYTKVCFGSAHSNDWMTASMFCGSGATNAEREAADPKVIAAFWHEHARASGAMCFYPKAKKTLEKSLELNKANNGSVYKDYFELARLHLDQKLYKEASNYFQLGTAATPKEIVAQDPIGYAEALDEYGEALKQIGDTLTSEKMIAESKQLRLSNPNVKSLTKRTPYGKFCNQKS